MRKSKRSEPLFLLVGFLVASTAAVIRDSTAKGRYQISQYQISCTAALVGDSNPDSIRSFESIQKELTARITRTLIKLLILFVVLAMWL